MEKEIKKIQLDLDDLLASIDNIDEKDDVYIIEKNIQEFNANYDKIDDRVCRIKEEIEETPENEKPLINKLKSIQNDMNKIKKKLNEKEKKLEKLKLKTQYYEGKLEGADKMQAEKEILLDNQKSVDYQGLMINSIQENVKAVGTNLANINAELDAQGEQMDRIHEKVLGTEDEVKKTSKIMNKIERRNNCMKVVSVIAIIVFALFDLLWIGYLLYDNYYKK